MTNERILIFRAATQVGLGHTLCSCTSYANYCSERKITLALDLRECKYTAPDSHQNFFTIFKFTNSNLDLITDEKTIDFLYSASPRIDWPFEEDIFTPLSNLSVGVNFFPNRFFSWPDLTSKRAVIELSGEFRSRFEIVKSSYFSDVPVIGVHFRQGNNEYLDGRFDPVMFDDYAYKYEELLQRYERLIGNIISENKLSEFKVLLCSDSKKFRDDLSHRVQYCFTVSDDVPSQSHLDLNFGIHTDLSKSVIIDLWSLSECDYMICGHSAYSRFALLNSIKLNHRNVHYVSAPHLFERIVDDEIRQRLTERLHLRNEPATFIAYANALENIGDKLGAAAARVRAEYLNYYVEATWQQSTRLVANGLINEAISLLEDCNKENPFFWSHLADLYFIKHRFDEALYAVERAVRIDPQWPWFELLKSEILLKKGDFADALVAAKKALRCHPHSPRLLSWIGGHFERG